MKTLKRKLITESIISIVIMLAGVWGIFSPFELSFVSPSTHLIISSIAMTFGFMSHIWNLDSYIGNATILEMKAKHEIELQKAKQMEISWKGNFKKIQGKYNAIKNHSKQRSTIE